MVELSNKWTIEQFLDFLKTKGHNSVKVFVVSRLDDKDESWFIPTIHYWVQVTTSGMQFILNQHMIHTAHPPTLESLHNKEHRKQNNDFYLTKVWELKEKIESRGFKAKIIDQMVK